MSSILLAVLIVAAIALLCGVLLAVFSAVFAVPVDEREKAITEILPGANCGSCGFSGCAGYAAALSKGETQDTGLCSPGGSAASAKIAEIMGLAAADIKPMAAVVMCQGHNDVAVKKMNYIGSPSCRQAQQLYGGPKECIFGCIGLGDCVKACSFDAIHICDGIARVNPIACRSCGLCIKTCPKGLIELLPLHETKAAVMCRNHDKGVLVRKECKMACLGCRKCEKACPVGAVKVTDFLAHIDYEKCIGCGKCAAGCPNKCIDLITLLDK